LFGAALRRLIAKMTLMAVDPEGDPAPEESDET
jgi:hypothetical protein